MRKFLFVCFIIFTAGVGCKKTNIGGGGLCGCSPIPKPELMLVIKNAAGDDLLSDKTAGAYTKTDLQLFKKDPAGKAVPLIFSIRQPFYYGNEKFNFNTLYSADLSAVKQSGESIYVKLGNEPVYELKLQINAAKARVDKLFINNSEADKATGTINSFADVFFLTK